LQNEFVKLRFDKLPNDKILDFINKVNIGEKLNLNATILTNIQEKFKSDIRAMINYMQTNQDNINNNYIISNKNFSLLYKKLNKNETEIKKYINILSLDYNMDKKTIIKNFLNYIIENHVEVISCELLSYIEDIMHDNTIETELFVYGILLKLKELIK